MPSLLSPGVRTRELDMSSYAAGLAVTLVGIVGGASRGPIGIPLLCSSANEFLTYFGDTVSNDLSPLSAIMMLQKGCSVWYMREENGNAAKASVSFNGVGVGTTGTAQVKTATVAGTVTAAGDVTVTVTAAGMTGSPKAVVVPILDTDTDTSVATKIRGALTADANVGAFFTISGVGTNVILTVKVNAANDATMNCAIAGGTTGISNAPTAVSTTAGLAPVVGPVVSDVFTVQFNEYGAYPHRYSIKISGVSGLDFTYTLYQGLVVVESFTASLDANSPKYIGNKTSSDFKYTVNLQTAVAFANSDKKAFVGGDNGLPLTTSNIVGAGNRGLKALANPNTIDISVIAVPGRSESVVINEMLRICESRTDCMAVIDPPGGLTVTEVLAFHNGTLGGITDPETKLDNSYGAMYYPWCKIVNPVTNATEWVPPSALVLGAYAVNDSKAHPWFAPAGLNRGGLSAAIDVERDLTEFETDLLYGNDNSINPIINFRKQGIVIWGQRTLQREDTSLDRINVRRMLIYIRKVIATSSAYVVFEQNEPETWSKWVKMVEPFLKNIRLGKGLYDYKVVMDETTVTPDCIDRNEMPGKVYLKPTKAVEYIIVDFILKSTGASFN